ncbi:MAG: hypothetical protein K9N47_07955 [Prosthecobacter sp.]|uniref:hypothetical protein n=1 Tax=Prosthecobacter sp. TaxID=1965333 RepID=UPI0025DB6D46|nr:hypothetical protein [Prosthecobacter sp.]MCF7786040.1 hypothetical protein [Prosthecobacter sp.]
MTNHTVILIAFACLFTGGVFMVLSFVAFDRLLRQVWAESEEAWIKLGRPCGFFWVPPGTSGVTKAGLVRSGLYGKWAAESDEPFAGNAEGVARLRWYKWVGSWCLAVGAILLMDVAWVMIAG